MFLQVIRGLSTDGESNVAHFAEHGLTPDDVEFALAHYNDLDVSRSTGRPVAFGPIPDGREIMVVFDWVDDNAGIVYPITAYEI